jgi:hypothetical protein
VEVSAAGYRVAGSDERSATLQAVHTEGNGRLEPVVTSFGERVEPVFEPGDGLGYPLAMVEWHDAWFDFDQETPEDCRSDYLVRTVGFLVADGPRFVSVAQEILPDGEGFRAVTHIPLPIVERIVRLHARPDLSQG